MMGCCIFAASRCMSRARVAFGLLEPGESEIRTGLRFACSSVISAGMNCFPRK